MSIVSTTWRNFEMSVKLKDLFLETLKREEEGTRKAMERVPEGENDWAPHEKSMKMGYLASLVATMPTWIEMMINQDELDFAPVGENKNKPVEWKKTSELVAIFDESMKEGSCSVGVDDGRASDDELEAEGCGSPDQRGATVHQYPARSSDALGASSRATDRIPSAEGEEGPRRIWAFSGREVVLAAHGAFCRRRRFARASGSLGRSARIFW